jgi:hypothetical protein
MKIWAYLALAVVILGFAKWAHGAVYEQGWNAANVASFEVQQEAIADAVKEARIQWDLSVVAATDNIIIEERIVERVEFVEREVIKIVDRVVPAECLDLGPDIQRVFNDAIRAAASNQGSDAADTAEPSG